MRWTRPEPNIALWDRIFRLLLGLSLAVVGFALSTWWGLLALWPLATAAAGWSPLYHLFGFTTCRYRFDQNICDESRL
ncbi:MAG TPA: DUF2892 domain-containing protein [Myxococcota bacterium]|nr:DUF2892 domain-containing protein [Myxococcota bacterium]HRY95908.1 DUF2892 domain-containing protein [Myxococcota bacterium]HSA24342.1 DUF2892 domain-containing protein [Myxococcota bacterium]